MIGPHYNRGCALNRCICTHTAVMLLQESVIRGPFQTHIYCIQWGSTGRRGVWPLFQYKDNFKDQMTLLKIAKGISSDTVTLKYLQVIPNETVGYMVQSIAIIPINTHNCYKVQMERTFLNINYSDYSTWHHKKTIHLKSWQSFPNYGSLINDSALYICIYVNNEHFKEAMKGSLLWFVNCSKASLTHWGRD